VSLGNVRSGQACDLCGSRADVQAAVRSAVPGRQHPAAMPRCPAVLQVVLLPTPHERPYHHTWLLIASTHRRGRLFSRQLLDGARDIRIM
jgi:hypothetical protein